MRPCLPLVLLAAVCFLPALRVHAFEAGAAKVEITPPVGTPLNGYGARQARPSVGIHDPVWSRCLYLDDGQTDLFLVAVDLVYINPELRARVLELAPDGTVRDRVILTATHTHYAQGAMNKKQPYRYVAGAFDPAILESTATAIARSMELALQSKQRAAIGFATIQQKDLTVNRRFKDGPIDEQIGVLLVENADGAPISVVTNLAAHPTSAPDDYLYHVSADFPGFYYAEMEALAGDGCVPLFINGAEGNQTITSPDGTSGWERTEKVGRLIAQRVHEALPAIECREEALHVAHSEPLLPPTVANYIQPERSILHSVEVGSLLMSFFPGEPCVELGLEMRRRALEAGYTAHFSVGLSNDYINYFVPPSLYDDLIYENAMNYFGPDVAEFLYTEFGKLMTRQPKAEPEEAPVAAQLSEFASGKKVTLRGDARERGRQRGEAVAEDLKARYQRDVLDAFQPGLILPDTAPYTMLPSFINAAAMGVVPLAITARAQLSGAADWQRDLVSGMAEGAGLPFDAVWLLQRARQIPAYTDKSPLFSAPLCTMFAIEGERAGGSLLVGRNLDWNHPEWPLVIEESGPDTLRTVSVGFTWNAGVYTGMNEKGVTVALQRLPEAGPPPWSETPLEMLLARVVAEAPDFPTALAMLQQARATHGIVLLAGPNKEQFESVVLRYAGAPEQRKPDKDYLPAIVGNESNLDADTRARYEHLASALSGLERVLPSDLMRLLSDETGEGDARIFNDKTAHSVVFEPARRVAHIAFPDPQSGALKHVSLSLSAGDAP